MNEQDTPPSQRSEATSPERFSGYPASGHENPDWRRLEVAAGRYRDIISSGIEQATKNQTNVDQTTARCIAHVLGRSLNQHSALAEYASSGSGDYEKNARRVSGTT